MGNRTESLSEALGPVAPSPLPLIRSPNAIQLLQGGSGTEPEPETGTVGTVFAETESGTGTAGTVFQEPKPEPAFPVKIY